jgi:hypothetical protein
MCLSTSRLKIGPTPDAGIFIGRFGSPREGVACAGRQSLGRWEKDISACGEKNWPSPCSSPPWRGNNIRCLAVHRRPSTSGDQGLSAAAGRPIQCERPNAIPSPGGEGQDEGELPAPKAVTLSCVPGNSISACGEKSSPSPGSSPREEEKPSGTHIGLAVQPPNAAMSTDALCPQQVAKLCGSARDVWERPEFRTSPTKSKQLLFFRGCRERRGNCHRDRGLCEIGRSDA